MKRILKLGLYPLIALGIIALLLSKFHKSAPTDITESESSLNELSATETALAQAPALEPRTPQADSYNHPSGCPCGLHPSDTETINDTATEAYPALNLPTDFIEQLAQETSGSSIRIDLPEGKFARGQIQRREFNPEGDIIAVEGILSDPRPGRFMFRKENAPGNAWPMSGVVIFKESDYAYRVEPSSDIEGIAELVQYPLGEVICNDFDSQQTNALSDRETTEILPEDHPTDIPIPDYQNGVIPLESLPGVTAVLYLDFDGEEGPHGSWGDFDALPATNLSVSNIFQVWRRVAEDFAPFNLNVTTDLQVYLDAPENSRQRCIITPTTEAAPGSGGVAYLQSFDWSGDVPCWAFYSSGKSAAEVISHELGHTLDLSHDGRTDPSEEYYSGHGSSEVGWAPIMGVGYYKTLSQWSKGEYANANRTEDDTLIIANNNNNVGFRSDDHGDTRESASYLEIFSDDSVDTDGTITTAADVDAFNFTTSGGQTTLSIDPESYGPNLDIYAALYDEQGTLIIASNPDTATDATLSANLSAGNYTIKISGTERDDPLANGYTDYGSLGNYSITGTATGGLGAQRYSLAENPSQNALIGSIQPMNDHGSDSLTYAIASGDPNNAFALNSSNGTLTVADPSQFDYETLSPAFNVPAEYELSVTLSNATRPSLDETLRVIVAVTDLNEAPVFSTSSVQIPEGLRAGSPVAQLNIQDPDQYQSHTYSIVSGNNGNYFQIDQNGQITIATPPDFDTATSYNLQIHVADSGSPTLTDTQTVSIEILNVIPTGYLPGIIYRNYYSDIFGYNVSNLTANSKFPESFDSQTGLEALTYRNIGDNYGATVRAFLIAPYTANYTFWIAGNNQSELYLSSNESPGNMSQIARVPYLTSEQDWYENSSQQSTSIALQAGQVYYLETRHKESSSDDHLAVAWQAVSGGFTLISQEIIPATFLAPHTLNYTPTLSNPADATIYENAYPGTAITDFIASDSNSEQTLSYAITGGDPNGLFAIDPVSGKLSLATHEALDAQNTPSHTVYVTVTDDGDPAKSATASVNLSVLPSTTILASDPVQEFWYNISGTNLTALYNDPKWPEFPDAVNLGTDFQGRSNHADNYGTRIRAYLTPETSGDYTFYIASDNVSTLILSSDVTAAKGNQIASVDFWTSPLSWNEYSSQQSAAISLVAGQSYFIEARLKEGDSVDHLAVAWTGPGISTITVIPAERLTPYDSNTAPIFANDSYAFDLASTATTGTTIGTVLASSQSFETIQYLILSGDDEGVFSIDSTTGQITLNKPNALIPGRIFSLSIGAQDDGYGGLFPHKETNTNVTISIPGTPIQTWRGRHFGDDLTDSQISGDLADPDNDQMNNLLEYALNLNPLQASDSNKLPQIETANNKLDFIYRKNLSANDLSFTIEQADNLSDTNPWYAATVLSEEILNDDGSTRLIRATLSNPEPAQKRFIRLKVELP
jgi:hypothetical protein